jgi:dTDP-glucose 4,6-dehydratase
MSELLLGDLDDFLARTPSLWEEIRHQRLFITGATGFFGCWLLETLLAANRRFQLNARVTILTRNPETLQLKAPHLASDPAVETLVGDVRDFHFPVGKFSHVIHAATDSSVDLNTHNPMLMFDTIVQGTRRCLAFAQAAETTKFLLLSSGAVYGKQSPDVSHLPEAATSGPDPLDATSAYAEGKRAAELLCSIAARTTALEPKVARCFAFVGPYMKLDTHFAIGNFIRDQIAGNPIQVSGDGTALRSYMYASDLMVWLWTILFRGTPMRAYNVGSQQALTIRELAHAVAEALTPKAEVRILGTPGPGPAQRYIPSTSRAQTELGLTCEVPLHEAIRRTQSWFLNRELHLKDARE